MDIFKKHKQFETNTVGVDYVIGDLHGEVVDLLKALELLDFDSVNDRVFSVGDLLDRGEYSFKTAELIYENWFHSVRGNHEQLMIDSIVHENGEMARTWYQNGGDWRYNHDPGELIVLAKDLMALPLVISVGEGDQRFNIVHGDLTHHVAVDFHPQRIPVTDQMIDNWEFNEDDEQNMLWGRRVYKTASTLNYVPTVRFHDPSLSLTFVGHTPVKTNMMVERQIYLDTGLVFHSRYPEYPDCCLTIAEPNQKLLHHYSPTTGYITTSHFDTILRYFQ